MRLALEILFDRIEKEPASDKWKLVGLVSAKEREALAAAIESLNAETSSGVSGKQTAKVEPAANSRISLNRGSMKLKAAENPDVTLCLDFGTATSKAFAMASSDSKPFGLALGTRSGAGGPVFAVPSSLYISDSGKIYFGRNAIDRSLRDDVPGRKRFDSPKQELSQAPIGNLGEARVSPEINPTTIPFSKKDLITLYLAFLTDLASTELKEKHGLSRYVARRFAIPCWDKERTGWAEQGLREMLAAAQVLADTLHEKWGDGLHVNEARQVLDLLEAEKPPGILIAGGVPEPIAAAASRVLRGEPQRRSYLVVDVGAGTTDFGLFVIAENPNKGWTRAFPVAGGLEGLRQAGDTVDSILRAEILSRHGFGSGGDDGIARRVGLDLELRIRQYKEQLFRDGRLEYRLSDDSRGVIQRQEFLDLPATARFGAILEDTLTGVLGRIDKSWIQELLGRQGITLVMTGGGSSLPMVRALADRTSAAYGIPVERSLAPALPKWAENDYPEYSDEYPQLAVAMGGAAPELPDMMNPVERFGGQAASTVRAGRMQITGT
jgi:molecular chaperone HscA